MTQRIEFVINVVGQATSAGSATDTIIQSANSGTSTWEIVNNSGQIVASVLGIIPILAPIALQTNTLAGTMTFLKITADVKDGKSIQTGDVLNLIGNAAGIALSMTVLLAGPPGLVLFLGGLGIASGLGGMITADGGLVDFTRERINAWWPSTPVIDLNPYWYDTEGRLRRYNDILADPNSGFRQIILNSANNDWIERATPEPPPRRTDEPEEVDGDGQL